jgi:aminoacrylate hydrolase
MPSLDRGGWSLHYEVAGEAPEDSEDEKRPAILLIQGCGVAGEGWRPQLDALARDHRVAFFDHRGIGKSELGGPVTIAEMTNDARAVLDALGWPSAHVVGHSMGGIVAQQLALDAPERVRSLALLCTFHRGRDGARLTPWLLWISLRMRVGPRAARRRAFLEMVMPAALLATSDRDAMAIEVGAVFGRDLADQPGIAMQQVRALGAHDASAQLDQLSSIPTLVVSATEDRIAPRAQGRALAGAIRGSRYVEIAEAAHGVTIQKADEITELLREHVAAAEQRSRAA